MPGWSGIQHRIDAPVEIVEHMCGRSGTNVAKEIGAGRGYRNPGTPDQLQRHRMRRHAHAHQWPPRRHRIRHRRGPWQQKSKRPRPKGPHQPPRRLGNFGHQPVEHRFVRYMNDHRIPCRPLLGREDARHRRRIHGIRAQSVYGLGGQRHQASSAEKLRRLVQSLVGFRAIHLPRGHR